VLTLSIERDVAERFPIPDERAEPVFERWRRAVDLVVRSDGPAHPEGVDGSALAVRRERLETTFRRDDLLTPVPRELIEAGYSAIIADADGYIIDEATSDLFAGTATHVRLVRGARWSEATRGTNAIGTAITEAQPIAVVGDAHYERQNRSLVCYAAPIRDPRGRVVAVFDVTSRVENASPLVGPLVTAIAGALERSLHEAAFARAAPGGLATLERLVEMAPGRAWLVGADGRVRAANSGRFGGTFELGWSELERAMSTDGAAILPSTDERLELQPVPGTDGEPIAVVCFSRGAARPRARSVHPAFDTIAGTDPALVDARALASRFASSNLPVMLLAETGSGKELFARALHAASSRADGPFVAVNCGALASSLLESELFGHAPGAFTGASAKGRDGMIGAASGGTLFLDEVAEMSPELQASLLRVLEDGSYRRLGETSVRHTDVRIVTATCRDLPAMVESGAFRNDLYYRLRGTTIRLPSVRARTDRIELARHLLERLALEAGRPVPRLGESAREKIEAHDWPGNVRELKMALAHALVLADDVMEAEHLPDDAPVTQAPVSHAPPSRSDAEREALARALAQADGNLSEAARILGVARTTLYRMKRRHRL
jgi:transcriptional regulator of acetoin/glycerol metabolism